MAEPAKKQDDDIETVLSDIDKDKTGTVVDLEQPDKTTDKPSSEQPTAEDEVARLKKDLEDYRSREAAHVERITNLEGERNAETQKTIAAISDSFKQREEAVEGRIKSSQTALASIKENLRAARQAGEIDKEIDLEEKLADEKYQLNALLWEKNNIATQKKTREDAAKNGPQQPKQRQYTSREQSWINDHPRYNTDDEYQSYVWSLDALAKKRGIVPDTDAYYEFLNGRLEKQYPPEGSKTVQVQPDKKISTAAPASRASAGGTSASKSSRQVTLTPDQLEAADACGMTPVEYAKELLKIAEEKK